MERDIYLILSSSSSLPAKVIKWATKNELNHASIALDDSLNKMYSFGRLKINQPFNAGFVVENKDAGFYAKFTDTKIRLYRVPVPEEVFRSVSDYMAQCVYGKEELKYNFIGAIFSKARIPVPRVNKYFCSEFAARVFEICHVREIGRDANACLPYDFLKLPNMELLYTGYLAKYSNDRPKVKLVEEQPAV